MCILCLYSPPSLLSSHATAYSSFFPHFPPYFPLSLKSNTSTSLGCTALPQTSPCYPHIQALLEGKVTSNNMSLIVSPLGNVSGLQANLKLLLRDPLSLLTPKCRSAGLPLYCNFLFPPCSNGSVDPTLQLTRSQCTTLVEDVCQKEFSLLMSFFDHIRDRVANVVPKCDALQEDNEVIQSNATAYILARGTGEYANRMLHILSLCTAWTWASDRHHKCWSCFEQLC